MANTMAFFYNPYLSLLIYHNDMSEVVVKSYGFYTAFCDYFNRLCHLLLENVVRLKLLKKGWGKGRSLYMAKSIKSSKGSFMNSGLSPGRY